MAGIKKLADLVRQPVGESSIALTRAYGESSQLGNLFTDAMLVAAPTAQIALINSGSLRADINAGTITFGDITSTFPFKNELTEMDLSGKDLRNLLEHGGIAYQWHPANVKRRRNALYPAETSRSAHCIF